MEYFMKKPLVLIVFSLMCALVQAQSYPLQSAVSESAIQLSRSIPKNSRVAVLNCTSSSPALSEYIVQELSFRLVSMNSFIIVDRANIALVKDELQFQLSGDVSDESAQSIGKMLGAQIIITCSVDNALFLRCKAIEVETARVLAMSSTAITPDDLYTRLTATKKESGLITVSTTEELIAAIAPERTIKLTKGTYDLTTGWNTKNRYISWVDEYDGPTPIIKAVSNLSLIGEEGVTIVIEPAYGWVISFDTCSDITISDIVIGHTVPGQCLGGVLRFKNCENIEIRSCDLYGSGTIGVELERTVSFTMENSIVRECTYGLLNITKSSRVSFRNTVFRTTGEYDLISVNSSDDVRWEDCDFLENWGSVLFNVDRASTAIVLSGGSIRENTIPRFQTNEKTIRIQEVLFEDNGFIDPTQKH